MSPMAMMAPCDGDVDWCHALGDFDFNLLRSSSSSSSSPHAMAGSRAEDFLPIAAAPPAPGAGGLLQRCKDEVLEEAFSDDAAFPAADCLSSALMNLPRDDESFYMSVYSAPPLPAVAGDQLYCSDQLPPLPADGALASLDEALLLPLSDTDLAAFDNVEEHRLPVDQMIMIPPPAGHHRHHHHHCPAGGQNAGVVVHVADEKKAMAIEDDTCFRPGGASGVEKLEMVVFGHDDDEHNHQAGSAAVAWMPPPPSSLPRPPRARRSGGGGDRSSAPAGKTRLDHIGFEDLRKYFYMPITRAAREMNVGLTVLKKRCRELGVARWPHRKMKSLKSLMANVQEMGNGMSPAAVQQELAVLETYCELMEEHPWIELTDRTKKLRQACFKESYKRRRAAAVNAMEMDHIYSGFGHQHGHHHQLLPPPPPASSAADDRRHGHHQSSRFFGY